MKKFSFLMLSFAVLIFSSCSSKLYVKYQMESANTGTIVLKSSKPTEKTFVTVNDNLIVKKKKVKSITIRNVPAGDYNIHYTCASNWYKQKLDVQIPVKMENGKEVTKLVEVPPYNTAYWFYMAGKTVLSLAMTLATR